MVLYCILVSFLAIVVAGSACGGDSSASSERESGSDEPGFFDIRQGRSSTLDNFAVGLCL